MHPPTTLQLRSARSLHPSRAPQKPCQTREARIPRQAIPCTPLLRFLCVFVCACAFKTRTSKTSARASRWRSASLTVHAYWPRHTYSLVSLRIICVHGYLTLHRRPMHTFTALEILDQGPFFHTYLHPASAKVSLRRYDIFCSYADLI